MSKRKIKPRFKHQNLLGTTKQKEAYKVALMSIARQFDRDHYVQLVPIDDGIKFDLKKEIHSLIEGDNANELILDEIRRLIDENKMIPTVVPYLFVPNGAVNHDGSVVPIDPTGYEHTVLMKRLRLHR